MTPQVLYLTHRVPYPPDKGDRIRNYHLLRQLSAKCSVTLACLADEVVLPATILELERFANLTKIVPVSKYRRWVRAGLSVLGGGSLSEGAFYESELMAWIVKQHRAEPFDAVVVSASSLVPYLEHDAFKDVPRYVDVVDVDSQKWYDFSSSKSWPKSSIYRLEGARVRKVEQRMTHWAAGISLVSPAEAAMFDRFTRPGAAFSATNGVDLDYFQATHDSVQPQTCAFVGALDYLPNIDAAVWFANEVWPRVLSVSPGAEFWLIGRKPAASVQALADRPGIRLIGQVPDVRPHLGRAAVAVVPMRLSRGLQNKVLEAMAMGKPTIAAPPALAALSAVVGQDLQSAETPDEWVKTILALFENPSQAQAIGAAGRAFVEEHHHWDKCLAPLVSRVVSHSADRSTPTSLQTVSTP